MTAHSEEFKREAVRIALTSGLQRDQVALEQWIGDTYQWYLDNRGEVRA